MSVSSVGAPAFVIHADVEGLRVSAGRLRARSVLFEDVSRALAAVEVWSWSGAAADIFRERFAREPSQWAEASWAFMRAGEALDEYADVVELCQKAALACQERYAYGQALNVQAEADWRNTLVFSAEGLVVERPGDEVKAGAERDFVRVVSELNTAGQECARALKAACANAPKERSWWDQVGVFAGGALEAAMDYAKLLFWPAYANAALVGRGYEIWQGKLTLAEAASLQMRPVEQARDLTMAAWTHPKDTTVSAFGAAFDVQTWVDDPARAAGRLVPDAVISALTGGVGAAANRVGKIAVKADEIAAGFRGLRHVNDPPVPRSFSHHATPVIDSDDVWSVKHAPQSEPSNHLPARVSHPDNSSPTATTQHADANSSPLRESTSEQGEGKFPHLEQRLNGTTSDTTPTLAHRVDDAATEASKTDNAPDVAATNTTDIDSSAIASNTTSREDPAGTSFPEATDTKEVHKHWELTPEVEARRARPATTLDDVCACVTRYDEKTRMVLAPPEDASGMNLTTRSLITDIDEIFGRNDDGSLRSYNEWHEKYSKWIEDSPEIYHGAYRAESHLFGKAVPESSETIGIEGIVHNGMTHHESTGIQETLRTLYDLPQDGVIRFDRIGPPSGQYLGLIGKDGPASFGERSLAPTSVHGQYHMYELSIDDLPDGWSMTVGKVAPWHGGKGGGIQIQFFGPDEDGITLVEKSITQVMQAKIVRDVTPVEPS